MPSNCRVGTTWVFLAAFTASTYHATPALANNGLNMIGFGAESTAMAGADIALARDTSALNTNPAGLAALHATTLDQYGAFSYNIDNAHADQFGNDQRSAKNVVWLAGGGFAAPLGASALTAGIGLFVQGGAGASYKNLRTAFGTTDNLSALFGIVRLTPRASPGKPPTACASVLPPDW